MHGYTADGAEIVRYDRAGKWYVEPKGGKRRHVKIAEAVQLAFAGRVLDGRYGGSRFGAKVAELKAAAR